jgi:hypothetical protein
VQLLGTNADFGTKSKLFAINKPSRSVDEYGGGVDPSHKLVCGIFVVGNDGFAVTCAVLRDMMYSLIKSVDDSHTHFQV